MVENERDEWTYSQTGASFPEVKPSGLKVTSYSKTRFFWNFKNHDKLRKSSFSYTHWAILSDERFTR